MKKNVLSKIMAVLVIVSCAFIFAACGSIQKPDVNITSFVIDESSIPEVIVVGEFDKANIKATVNYSDGTNEPIIITTAMIPEEYRELLNTPGIYDIELMFRNQKAELQVRMVNSTNIYQVNFYNHKNQIISTQFVYDGEDATLPTDFMASVEGYAFVEWDRSHEDISEDTNIYGLYVNIENTLSDAKMMEVLLNAEQYYITHDHFTTTHSDHNYGEQSYSYKTNTNYHYDSENQVATSQSTTLDSHGGKIIAIMEEEKYEILELSSAESSYDSRTYEQLKADEYNVEEELMTDEEFNQMILNAKLYGGDVEMGLVSELLNGNYGPIRTVDFSYEITSNKLIYTCTITYTDNSESSTEIDSYTIKYDDEKILQILCNYSFENSTYNNSTNTTINIDYATFEFEELIGEEMRVLCDLDLVMQDIIKSDFTLTATFEGETSTVKFDADNNILKLTSPDSVNDEYKYLSGDHNEWMYEGDITELEKTHSYNWDSEILEYWGYSFSRVAGGNPSYTTKVSVDDEGNHVVTLFNETETELAVWTFNNADGLVALNLSGMEIGVDTTTAVNLTVPEEIKAMEKDAQIY